MKQLFLAFLGCLAISMPFIHGMESGVKRQTITEQPAALALAAALLADQTLFHAAVEAGAADAVKELLDADDLFRHINLSALYPSEMRPSEMRPIHFAPPEAAALHVAAALGHTAVASVLVDHGADVDILDSNGMTPLMWAAQEGHLAMVKLLIEAGADVTIEDSQNYDAGWSAYTSEEQRGEISIQEVVRYFVERGWYHKYLLNCPYILESPTLVVQVLGHGKPIPWGAQGEYVGNWEIDHNFDTDNYVSPLEYARQKRLPSFELLIKAYACDNLTHGAEATYKSIFAALCTFQRLNQALEAHQRLPRVVQWQILCGSCLAGDVLKGATFVKKKHRRNYEYLMETIQKRCGKLFNVAQILQFFLRNSH